MRKWVVLLFIAAVGVLFAQVDSAIVFPLEDFSGLGGVMPAGWVTYDVDGAPSSNFWFIREIPTIPGDTTVTISWALTYQAHDWLVTPQMDASGIGDSVILHFWDEYYHYAGEIGSSYVIISTAGTDTIGDTIKTYLNSAVTYFETGTHAIHLEGYDLTGPIYISFLYNMRSSLSWDIDDVKVVRYFSEPMPPTFDHAPYYRPAYPYTLASFPISCDIFDLTGVASAQICYDIDASGFYTCAPMSFVAGDEWTGTIPLQPAWSEISYCFIATDAFATPSTDTSDTFDFIVQGEYYAYDDVDADPEAPDNAWIDVTALPGAYQIDGTWTLTTDFTDITLPFDFTYYGLDYSSVAVHMAGFCRFGALGASFDPASNQDFPDPDPNGPDGVIAGCWAEFLATAGVGGDVWVYDTDNDTFIVLFNNMDWLLPGGGSIVNITSYEIIFISPTICDEAGGNGEIICKYQTVNDDTFLIHSTVGVENDRGELGTTYLYNGAYDPEAEGIEADRAIKFTSNSPLFMEDKGVIIGYADLLTTLPLGDPGINIDLIDAGLSTFSDGTGRYVFTSVDTGTYVTRGWLPDCNYDMSIAFTVEAGETTWVDTLYIRPWTFLDYNVETFEDGPEPGIADGSWQWGEYDVNEYVFMDIPIFATPPDAAHSYTHMWGTVLSSDYYNDAYWLLSFPTGPRWISFWHYYDNENGWDGGQVLYSQDNGNTWFVGHTVNGYDDIVDALADSGFTGNSGGWVQDSIDLTATTATHIGFLFASDYLFHYAGWYLDDIYIPDVEHDYAQIDGYIYDDDTHAPIYGADVICDGDADETDAIGHYNLFDIVPGAYELWAGAPGYIPDTRDVIVGANDIIRVNVPLVPVDINPGYDEGYVWDITYGEDDSAVITICNPTDDTILVILDLITGTGTGGGLFRSYEEPYSFRSPDGNNYMQEIPAVGSMEPTEKGPLSDMIPHKTSFDKASFMNGIPALANISPDFTHYSSNYSINDKALGLAFVDSIDIRDIAAVATPTAVACRGFTTVFDYWITSLDRASGESYNLQFGPDKLYTGTFYSTEDYTDFFYYPYDMAFDGSLIWQIIPGLDAIYAWDPSTGALVDSILAPIGVDWGADDILCFGLAYDPAMDVFYLGDTLGEIWQVKGKYWDVPGEALGAWAVFPSVGYTEWVMGLAFDPIRRTLWANSPFVWGLLVELDPSYIFGNLYLVNVTDDFFDYIIYGMEMDSDHKLWGTFYDPGLDDWQVYGIGNLPEGAYASGFGLSDHFMQLDPGECEDIIISIGNLTAPGYYDLTLGIWVGTNDGIFSDVLEYPLDIYVSRSLHQGWNLVAFPVAANPDNIYIQLSDDIAPFYNEPAASNIYVWDPERGILAIPDGFERGRGYYLKAWNDDTHIDVAGVPFYDTFTLTLPYFGTAAIPGWNLVGNPVNYEIDWDNIVANPAFTNISNIYYTITEFGWAAYSPGFPAGASRIIEPYMGFFVDVNTDATGVLPFGESSFIPCFAKKTEVTTELPDFTIRLEAVSEYSLDKWNYLATRPTARDFIDALDIVVPPIMNTNEDFAAFMLDGNDLMGDIKAPMNDGDSRTWSFRIDGLTISEEVSIAWADNHIPDSKDASQGMNQIYGGYSFDLYDAVTGEHIDMRATENYSFTYTGSRTIIITAYASVLETDDSDKVPGRFALVQNVPNPFNATTEITFSIPTDSYVALDILDLSGRIVRALVSGEQESGWHSVRWDGTDNEGTGIAAGIYFYRLRTKEFSETRKMMLVK